MTHPTPKKPAKVDMTKSLAANPYFIGPAGVSRGSPNFEAATAEYFQRTNPDMARRMTDPMAVDTAPSYQAYDPKPAPTIEDRVLMGPARMRANPQEAQNRMAETYAQARRSREAIVQREQQADVQASIDSQKAADQASGIPGSPTETTSGLAPGANTPVPSEPTPMPTAAYEAPASGAYGEFTDLLGTGAKRGAY